MDTSGNSAHAATFIRKRLILLDDELRGDPREHARILAHERFHFVWVRLGNPLRLLWERHLQNELNRGARGETGWSAEWRKRNLTDADITKRTQRWREYCCESFCDTAAWLVTGVKTEVTLGKRHSAGRKLWFARHIEGRRLPI